MSVIRDSVVFYRSWYDVIMQLPTKKRLECLENILNYGLNGVAIDEKNIGYLMAKKQIDANNIKFLNGKKGGNFGFLGGKPKPQENPKKTPKKPQANPKKTPKKPQANPKKTPNVNDNDNVNVNDNDNVNVNDNDNVNVKKSKEKKVFKKPTLTEIEEEIKEKNYSLNAEHFYNYYEANGWNVGKNKMKNWKAALAMWNSRESKDKKRLIKDTEYGTNETFFG